MWLCNAQILQHTASAASGIRAGKACGSLASEAAFRQTYKLQPGHFSVLLQQPPSEALPEALYNKQRATRRKTHLQQGGTFVLIYGGLLHACLEAKNFLPDFGRCLCMSCIAAEKGVKVMAAVTYFSELPLIGWRRHICCCSWSCCHWGCSKPACFPPLWAQGRTFRPHPPSTLWA